MTDAWGRRLRRALTGKDPDDEALSGRLTHYPPLRLPHTGAPGSLDASQAEANLAAWVAAIPARLDALRALVTADRPALSWPEDPARADATGLVTGLHHWAGERWPPLTPELPADVRERWLANERDGELIALSMTADVAMLIGESIRTRRASLDWGIDRDPVNRADGMASFNRVVLLGDWLADAAAEPPVRVVIDVEEVVLARLLRPNDSAERFENRWTRLVEQAVSGAHEGANVTHR